MKILVMSDSHGDTTSMLTAVSKVCPDLILHLGDHERDCTAVTKEFRRIPLRSVCGNCDRSRGLERDEFVLEGKRFFMTHGHIYGVKLGLDSIVSSSAARGADILLFGHTHNPYYARLTGSDIIECAYLQSGARDCLSDGMIILNPGSIGRPHGNGKKTYAVLEIENGAASCFFGSIGD